MKNLLASVGVGVLVIPALFLGVVAAPAPRRNHPLVWSVTNEGR